jgi:hypothetical protein
MFRLRELSLLLTLSAALAAAGPGLNVTLRVRDVRHSRATFVTRYARSLDRALTTRGLGRVTTLCVLPLTPAAETTNIELELEDRDLGLPFLLAYVKAHRLPAYSSMAYLDRGRVNIICFTDS